MIHSKLIKDGNDFIVPLPKKIVKELNLKVNQDMGVDIYTLIT
jgi:antitoxin component of MazEF toxin-antitoxin module